MKNLEDHHHHDIVYSNLKVLEEERQRFAQDLHDEIGASLSAIRLYVSSIDRTAQETELKSKLQEVKQTIDQSMASTRRIAYNLLPPNLEVMGLSAVVKDLADSFKKSPMEVLVSVQPGQPKLNYQRELILYRVVQEFIGNTLKHASANQITIGLSFDEKYYKIVYTDNGKGFDMNRIRKPGMGLVNIKNRLGIVGGEIYFKTAPGAGFEAMIHVPLQFNNA